jgi:DNA-binding transcriptional MocR family regulator
MEAEELLGRVSDWDRRSGHPSTRLAVALETAIADGRVPAGVRLPSERAFAEVLEVSRGTVVRTYARLREVGVVHTRRGSGTVVGSEEQRPDRAAQLAGALSSEGSVAALGVRDADAIDLRAAAWLGDREMLRSMSRWDPADLPDIGGSDNGYWPLGLPALRTAIAGRLSATGLPSRPDQIIVTNGAQQALDVALTTVAGPQDTVVVAEVTWPGIQELLSVRNMRPVTVPLIDHHHVDQVALVRHLREGRSPAAYLVPTFDNPTGAVMPGPARRLVVEAALEGGTVLIDDLTLSELWLDEPPPPPLGVVLPEAAAQVVTVGSLSKLAWGGLRVGWLRAEGPLLERLGQVKTVLDFGNAIPSQLAALTVMRQLDGMVVDHRAELVRRRAALTADLAELLPNWRFVQPSGGMSVWVDLGGVSGDAFAATAARYGVQVSPARVYHALGQDLGHVRLTLTHDVETTREAVRRLAEAWAHHLASDRGRRIAIV